MKRLTLKLAVAMSASIMASSLNGLQKNHELSKINYVGRGKSGKSPRTFSGVARARRAAQKARNKAS